jgi:hypothetical protein
MPRKSGESEHEISHKDRDPKEENDALSEIEKISHEQSESFIADNQILVDNINREIARIEAIEIRPDDNVIRVLDYFYPASSEENIDQAQVINDLLEDNSQEEAQQNILNRFFAWFMGIFRNIFNASQVNTSLDGENPPDNDKSVYVLFAYLIRLAKDEPTDDLKSSLSEELQKSADELFVKFREQSDADFWSMAAKYQQEADSEATLADHIYFCQFIKELSLSPDLWIWDTGEDQTAMINTLVDFYHQSPEPKVAALYSNVSKLTYQDNLLPRDIAADLVELSLANILQTLPK